jgi:hypothetical protein
MAAESGGLHRLRILYGLRNYRIYVVGDFVSLIGNWAQRVAIGWLTWQLTGSATWLGIIAFADLFPSVALAPLGGVIADRGDPRSISFKTQAVQMGHATALCLLMDGGLGAAGAHARPRRARCHQPAGPPDARAVALAA